MTILRKHVGPRLSETAVFNGVVYLAGQVADDPDADMATQTNQVLGSIDRLLAEVGSSKAHLLQVTIFIKDMKDFPKLNAIWETWVVPGATPPRATVQALMANPKYLVEIKVIAAVA
jgi:enamine deaminase RidA (YjgF/YER057c/UK114 family)